jgi:hypothetical protein
MMGGGPLDPEPLLRMLRSPRMLNKYLIAICKEMRVQYAGATKAVMQQRIADGKSILHSVLKHCT